jgi:hypothetical protein
VVNQEKNRDPDTAQHDPQIARDIGLKVILCGMPTPKEERSKTEQENDTHR